MSNLIKFYKKVKHFRNIKRRQLISFYDEDFNSADIQFCDDLPFIISVKFNKSPNNFIDLNVKCEQTGPFAYLVGLLFYSVPKIKSNLKFLVTFPHLYKAQKMCDKCIVGVSCTKESIEYTLILNKVKNFIDSAHYVQFSWLLFISCYLKTYTKLSIKVIMAILMALCMGSVFAVAVATSLIFVVMKG